MAKQRVTRLADLKMKLSSCTFELTTALGSTHMNDIAPALLFASDVIYGVGYWTPVC